MAEPIAAVLIGLTYAVLFLVLYAGGRAIGRGRRRRR